MKKKQPTQLELFEDELATRPLTEEEERRAEKVAAVTFLITFACIVAVVLLGGFLL